MIQLATGSSQSPCSVKTVKINQSKSGLLAENKPEWMVTITNDCPCSQLDLTLYCNGYQTVKAVDPWILTSKGQTCLVNNGQPIYAFTNITFTYAWDTSFPFRALSSQIACS